MADQTFMFIVTAGTMAGLVILLFVSRGRRLRAIKTTDKEHALSPGFLLPLRRRMRKIRKVSRLKNIHQMENQFMKKNKKKAMVECFYTQL